MDFGCRMEQGEDIPLLHLWTSDYLVQLYTMGWMTLDGWFVHVLVAALDDGVTESTIDIDDNMDNFFFI